MEIGTNGRKVVLEVYRGEMPKKVKYEYPEQKVSTHAPVRGATAGFARHTYYARVKIILYKKIKPRRAVMLTCCTCVTASRRHISQSNPTICFLLFSFA